MRAAATLFVSAVRTALTPAASSTAAGASGRSALAGAGAFAFAGAGVLVAGFVAFATISGLAAAAFLAAVLPSGADVLRADEAVDFAAALTVVPAVFGAAFAALEVFWVPVATARVFVTFAPALDLACAVALFKGARAAWFRDVAFRAEVFAAADLEADEPDLAAVLDAADAAFFDATDVALLDATEVALRDATDVARDLLDDVVARRDVVARPGLAAALAFEALVLTDEVFTELFFAEAFAIVFALLAGALDATGLDIAAFADFDFAVEVALAVLLLGGMVGTLPG